MKMKSVMGIVLVGCAVGGLVVASSEEAVNSNVVMEPAAVVASLEEVSWSNADAVPGRGVTEDPAALLVRLRNAPDLASEVQKLDMPKDQCTGVPALAGMLGIRGGNGIVLAALAAALGVGPDPAGVPAALGFGGGGEPSDCCTWNHENGGPNEVEVSFTKCTSSGNTGSENGMIASTKWGWWDPAEDCDERMKAGDSCWDTKISALTVNHDPQTVCGGGAK